MKSIRLLALMAGAFLCLPATQVLSDSRFTDSLETAFVDGGQITIELSVGEHTISESADNNIRVYWRVKDENRVEDVDASTDVDGRKANIDLDGPRNDFLTVVEVPRHSDLTVHLTAGELDIACIEGDKDIRLRAGELSIEVGNPEEYAHVEGSLWAGDIDAGPFARETSGLFRSIEWQGEGKRQLRFKLLA
ncbi:MAG: hypothetical protein PVF46_03675, partial [Lysobacterales bacterium]